MENKLVDGSERGESFDKISETYNENILEEPWLGGSVNGRAERLQSNAALNSRDRKQRRNDTLFFGKFSSTYMSTNWTFIWSKKKKVQNSSDSQHMPF